jgi:hypothetical protein
VRVNQNPFEKREENIGSPRGVIINEEVLAAKAGTNDELIIP